MTRHPDYGVCSDCGYRMFPVLDLFPCGHDGGLARQPLDSTGTVYSWTRSWTAKDHSNLIVMADFFDGELRVTAPLLGADEVAIGDEVRVVSNGTEGAFALRHA